MKCQVRISEIVWSELSAHIFRRYPRKEWGAFLDCGWAEVADGLVLTIKGIRFPSQGDLDESIAIFGVNNQYTERTAFSAEEAEWAVGVVHSHPEAVACFPSDLDDDMDTYFAKYFASFAPGRPYVSVIFSRDRAGQLHFSGRCWWKNKWLVAEKVTIVGSRIERVWSDNVQKLLPPTMVLKRLGRLASGLGAEAAVYLWNSTAVIIGAGGTGSPLVHSLARSGVRRIIVIDPELLDDTNAERIHGVLESDLKGEKGPAKVKVAERLVGGICSEIELIPLQMNALDPVAFGFLMGADIILGCTDSEHGRALVSDLATRFLIPAIHVNVGMESKSGSVSGEIVHITQYGPGVPCAYCRGQIDGQLLAQELMPESEKVERKTMVGGENGGAYWREEPIIPTIGSLTTFAGEMAANYAIGLLTERYGPPANFLEVNLLAPSLGVVDTEFGPIKGCLCGDRGGGAGQLEPLVGRK